MGSQWVDVKMDHEPNTVWLTIANLRLLQRVELTMLALEPDEISRLRDVFAAEPAPVGEDSGARLLRKIRATGPTVS
jgi:hypothetical protein